MLFALFFGSGNLIYPAFLGIYSGSNLALAILGFCLTGVTLPLLGVVAVAYSGDSDVEDFARPVSRHYALLFSIALYLSIGPFFAIPRTGATSFSIGIQPILGDSISVKVDYGLLFFGLSYILAIKPSKIADRIGKYLTPALLIILAILVIASFIKPAGDIGTAYNAANDISNAFKEVPFVAGLIQGYGTMDALASLAFAIIVIDASKQHGAKNQSEVALLTFKSWDRCNRIACAYLHFCGSYRRKHHKAYLHLLTNNLHLMALLSMAEMFWDKQLISILEALDEQFLRQRFSLLV